MQKRSIFRLLVWALAALLWTGGMISPAAEAATVTITSPKYDSEHALGESLVFSCNVKSAGGGEVPNVKLIWTSQLDGKIGEGALLKINTLTVGIHRITVEAYDEGGGSMGTASIKLKISQVKDTGSGTDSVVTPTGVGKGEPYVVNPFN
jgi:hypothetical protein